MIRKKVLHRSHIEFVFVRNGTIYQYIGNKKSNFKESSKNVA